MHCQTCSSRLSLWQHTQVTDREEEVVDVWHEGDVRYERVLNKPDYEKWVPAIGRKYVKPKASPTPCILAHHGL